MDALELVRSIQHACVQLEQDGIVVAIDPYRVKHATHDADLIIVTHEHSDHFSPEDIEKLYKDSTCYICPKRVAQQLEIEMGIDSDYICEATYDTPMVAFPFAAVTPVVAQNSHHAIEDGFGAVVEFGGFTYYLSSDTDVLAENVKCDVLFVCCDGKYNMPEFAQRIPAQILAMDTMPGIVVPYHVGFGYDNSEALCEALRAAGIPCKAKL